MTNIYYHAKDLKLKRKTWGCLHESLSTAWELNFFSDKIKVLTYNNLDDEENDDEDDENSMEAENDTVSEKIEPCPKGKKQGQSQNLRSFII